MEKYIKANTVLKFINSCLEHEDKITDIEKAVLTGVKTCVERISAANVVEVMRCGQCKCWKQRENREYGLCAKHSGIWLNSDFCSQGEPKDGGQKNGVDISI
jgi:hypothetical protein